MGAATGVAAAAGAAAAAAMAGGESPEVKVEIGVPHTLLGGYLAQSRAMFLANAYLERSQCLASRLTFICAADRYLSARANRKMVIFYVYLRYFLKKSRFYRTDMQIKIIETVCEGKTFTHRLMCICVSIYFLKKSQPKGRNYPAFCTPVLRSVLHFS